MHQPSYMPDATVFIQMAIFFASWAVLHFLVFKPYLNLLNLRRDKTTGLMEKAEADRLLALDLQAKYEARMKEERKAIVALVEAERQKITFEEREVIQATREATSDQLKKLRSQVDTQYDRARNELLTHVGEYSSSLASKLVGQRMDVPASGPEFSRATAIEPTVPS